jgi:hypothetical protein
MSQDITDLLDHEDRLKSAYFRSISKMRRNPSGGRNGGRPRTAARCLCGMYTQAGLARRPNHACDTSRMMKSPAWVKKLKPELGA